MTQIAQAPDAVTAVTSFPPIAVPEADLTDLRRRVNPTRWPAQEIVADDTQGVQLGLMQALASYWGGEYSWRPCEAKLNVIPQFTTVIDGQTIHFMHAKSKYANALLAYYKKHDVGGHFAAWEQPELFSEDVRATFRSLQRTTS